MAEKKMYLLDTNVMLHDPLSLYSFENVHIGIPAIVLEELDQFKKEGSERGRNTRQVIRMLDQLRQKGSLGEGVELDNGSTVQVVFLRNGIDLVLPFKTNIEDNEILLTALSLKNKGWDVQFISKDLNARVKADSLGIGTQDYVKEAVSEQKFYKGWVRIPVPAGEFKKDKPDRLVGLIEEKGLVRNEFVLLESQHNPHNYKLFRYNGGKNFIPVQEPKLRWPLKPRNAQQLMAMNLLLDPEIQICSLFGPAGTGKTFLALLCGLHEVLVTDSYEKLMVARPIVPLGKDIGYLPGTVEEKLYSWMLPVYDNMEFIVHSSKMGDHEHRVSEEQKLKYKKGKHHKGKKFEKDGKQRRGLQSLEELIRRNKISLEAITYMRGRSIPYQYIFIDEVQNLTPHEVKTLVSRVGQGSKIVLAGDPFQIDSPYLDFSSNGLVVTSEKLKGHRIYGSVYLETSERSEISQMATDLL